MDGIGYHNFSLCTEYLHVVSDDRSATRIYEFPIRTKENLDTIDPTREKKFLTYLMSRSSVKYSGCRYPILGFYSDMSDNDRRMVADILGLE